VDGASAIKPFMGEGRAQIKKKEQCDYARISLSSAFAWTIPCEMIPPACSNQFLFDVTSLPVRIAEFSFLLPSTLQ
jgi:hypothetical protein